MSNSSRLKSFLTALLVLASLSNAAAQQARDVSRESARQSPAWVRDGIVYEIYPRAFSQEGNFKAITARVDDLKSLGVTILWLMPIHPIGQEKKKGSIGSPYAVRDYYAINDDYGSKDDLRRLITEAHRRGMRVILDMVANHTSWDSVLMKHPDYYVRDASGRINYPHDWSDVAELNYDNPKLRDYMIEMLKYWVREFDIDGYRCDVAGEVPTDFWERARAELEKIKPDIGMLAESEKPELLVKAFDFDYAWNFHNTLNEVMTGRAPASKFRQTWTEDRAKYPRGALRMRFSDNHDERRAIARFGERGALAASVLMFTLDGVPMLYNGMEVGDTTESGAPALFERLPVFWPIAERRPEFPRFYREIIALHKEHAALSNGNLVWLANSDPARVVTFSRRNDDEEIVVAINFSNRPFKGTVQTTNAAAFTEITPSLKDSTDRGSRIAPLSLDAWGWRIFRRPLRR
ncbi:MAG TPA: alpha-amylase family glycosyl hydrolase [Blastocatellia bacterium]|nr:alpha-amylase family glycosyl hydrolase [Blastocatellia bacterium]